MTVRCHECLDPSWWAMGNALSRVRGFLVTRPLQRFNADARAERAFEKDALVPRPAPM